MNASFGAALLPVGQIHYIDHLAVVSEIFDLPLIVLDNECEALAKKYYPRLHLKRVEEVQITPEFLIGSYNVLFTSDLWNQAAFDKQFKKLEERYNKRMRRVFCPHGFSDKTFYFKSCKNEDICLVYGEHLLDMLKSFYTLKTIQGVVVTGNARYAYYKREKAFFDKLIEQEVIDRFKKKQSIILYAPTWQDYEESTTFFEYFNEILEKLPESLNLIVKLHPLLEMNDPVAYYSILGKYEKKPNVLFLREFPLVYPLLAQTDLYVGDMSSVGYDFLAFNKPMIFLNKGESKENSHPQLYQCGLELHPHEFHRLYPLIQKQLQHGQEELKEKRKELYLYTFGEERPFQDIKQDLLNLL